MLEQTESDAKNLADRTRISFAIGRVEGTVMVTVGGEADRSGVEGLAGF